VELQDRERHAVEHAHHLVEGRVHEHADELDLAPERGPDRGRFLQVATARAPFVKDHPDRPGAEVNGRARVLDLRDAADLDPGAQSRPIVAFDSPRPAGGRG